MGFSVQPLCSLCLCGVCLLGIHQPQRHREHRSCTEKKAFVTFCASRVKVVVRIHRLANCIPRTRASVKNTLGNLSFFWTWLRDIQNWRGVMLCGFLSKSHTIKIFQYKSTPTGLRHRGCRRIQRRSAVGGIRRGEFPLLFGAEKRQ